ncbi:MAG: hypothetical protein ACH350_06735 [Parachlamydiaceae bacterium]
MNIQASHNLQYAPITDIKIAVNEKKVDGARSFLFGKIGRTWSGFVSDWAATFFGSNDLKGKGFFQRWSILARAPITLQSVKKGHDHAHYFVSQLIKQLNQLSESIRGMDLNDYQSEQLDTLLDTNTFKEKLKTLNFKKELENFITKMVRFEKKLIEIPTIESDPNPLTSLLSRMAEFIEKSEFNPKKKKEENGVPQTALEKSQQAVFEATCQRMALLTEVIEKAESTQDLDIKTFAQLEQDITAGIETYKELGVARTAMGVRALQKGVRKWKAFAARQKIEKTKKVTGGMGPKSFLDGIKKSKPEKETQAPQTKPNNEITQKKTPIPAEPSNNPIKLNNLTLQDQLAAKAKEKEQKREQALLLAQLKEAETIAQNPDFKTETEKLVQDASELQSTLPTDARKTVVPQSLLAQIQGQKKTLKKAEVKSTEEKKKETKATSWQDDPAVLAILARRKGIEPKDGESETESEKGDW